MKTQGKHKSWCTIGDLVCLGALEHFLVVCLGALEHFLVVCLGALEHFLVLAFLTTTQNGGSPLAALCA
jgi:uncharacterized membrane protein required for colicin V production